MMRRIALPAFALLAYAATQAPAYVEAPYSLGQVIKESTHIVLVEVTKVNKEKNLIIYKKLADMDRVEPVQVLRYMSKQGNLPSTKVPVNESFEMAVILSSHAAVEALMDLASGQKQGTDGTGAEQAIQRHLR